MIFHGNLLGVTRMQKIRRAKSEPGPPLPETAVGRWCSRTHPRRVAMRQLSCPDEVRGRSITTGGHAFPPKECMLNAIQCMLGFDPSLEFFKFFLAFGI